VAPGSAEVAFSREAIAVVIQGVMPKLIDNPRLLTLVPLANDSTQVNLHGFGPFGALVVGGADARPSGGDKIS
jgi:hypothetical protein